MTPPASSHALTIALPLNLRSQLAGFLAEHGVFSITHITPTPPAHTYLARSTDLPALLATLPEADALHITAPFIAGNGPGLPGTPALVITRAGATLHLQLSPAAGPNHPRQLLHALLQLADPIGR